MTLTKLDNVFDSIIYDGDLIQTTMFNSLEMYGICHLFTFFGSVFASYFNWEFYVNFYEYLEYPERKE